MWKCVNWFEVLQKDFEANFEVDFEVDFEVNIEVNFEVKRKTGKRLFSFGG